MTKYPNYLGGVKATLAYLSLLILIVSVAIPMWQANLEAVKVMAAIFSPLTMMAFTFYFAGKVLPDK